MVSGSMWILVPKCSEGMAAATLDWQYSSQHFYLLTSLNSAECVTLCQHSWIDSFSCCYVWTAHSCLASWPDYSKMWICYVEWIEWNRLRPKAACHGDPSTWGCQPLELTPCGGVERWRWYQSRNALEFYSWLISPAGTWRLYTSQVVLS